MINFKNNAYGFTLTEVLIALAIVGLALSPILILQNRSVLSTGVASQGWDRFSAAYAFLVDKAFVPNVKQERSATKKLTTPLTALRYEQRDIPEASALSSIKNITLDQVVVDWRDRGKKRKSYRLISFSLVSEEGKHEAKS